MYLRIIVHANEHMGQLIAYARMTGVVPPWSKKLRPKAALPGGRSPVGMIRAEPKASFCLPMMAFVL